MSDGVESRNAGAPEPPREPGAKRAWRTPRVIAGAARRAGTTEGSATDYTIEGAAFTAKAS